jgi:hypothetical protein
MIPAPSPAMEPQRQSHIIKQKTGPDDPELQATLQEALAQVSPEDVIAIADELAERRDRLFLPLQRTEPDGWKIEGSALSSSFAGIAAAVTHTRANARFLKGYFGPHNFELLGELTATVDPTPVRVASLVEKLNALDTRLALELATGLLSNIDPREHWLWTRWLWDPTTGTGILPLLAGSVHNLVATGIAEGYARVGAVTAMSMKFAEGTGLWSPTLTADEKRAPFANSAFLACAYSIYMYGSTGWRLSREFNDLLPGLPNMARRLLGLPKVKDAEPAEPDGGEGS